MGFTLNVIPTCGKCQEDMLPLEDTHPQGNISYLKAWVCSNPECDNAIIFKNGIIIRPKIAKELER